jgi:hypothetical protein
MGTPENSPNNQQNIIYDQFVEKYAASKEGKILFNTLIDSVKPESRDSFGELFTLKSEEVYDQNRFEVIKSFLDKTGFREILIGAMPDKEEILELAKDSEYLYTTPATVQAEKMYNIELSTNLDKAASYYQYAIENPLEKGNVVLNISGQEFTLDTTKIAEKSKFNRENFGDEDGFGLIKVHGSDKNIEDIKELQEGLAKDITKPKLEGMAYEDETIELATKYFKEKFEVLRLLPDSLSVGKDANGVDITAKTMREEVFEQTKIMAEGAIEAQNLIKDIVKSKASNYLADPENKKFTDFSDFSHSLSSGFYSGIEKQLAESVNTYLDKADKNSPRYEDIKLATEDLSMASGSFAITLGGCVETSNIFADVKSPDQVEERKAQQQQQQVEVTHYGGKEKFYSVTLYFPSKKEADLAAGLITGDEHLNKQFIEGKSRDVSKGYYVSFGITDPNIDYVKKLKDVGLAENVSEADSIEIKNIQSGLKMLLEKELKKALVEPAVIQPEPAVTTPAKPINKNTPSINNNDQAKNTVNQESEEEKAEVGDKPKKKAEERKPSALESLKEQGGFMGFLIGLLEKAFPQLFPQPAPEPAPETQVASTEKKKSEGIDEETQNLAKKITQDLENKVTNIAMRSGEDLNPKIPTPTFDTGVKKETSMNVMSA